MNFKLILIMFLFAATRAFAAGGAFHADAYEKGLHMFAGAGVNGSFYNSEYEKQNEGLGVNFLTNFGYYFDDKWAFELGSMVKANYVQDTYIWDTLLTSGLRYRFQKFPWTNSKGIYARLFAGRAPTVAYTKQAPSVVTRTKASRIQFDGPVFGFALGNMYDSKDGKVWFVEYGFSFQTLDHVRGINNDGEVPVTVFNKRNTDEIRIYSLYFNIGILVF